MTAISNRAAFSCSCDAACTCRFREGQLVGACAVPFIGSPAPSDIVYPLSCMLDSPLRGCDVKHMCFRLSADTNQARAEILLCVHRPF